MSSSFDAVPKKVTVVIPNRNGIEWLPNCLQAVATQNTSGFDILVVDDASTDGSIAFIKENFPEIQLISLPAHSGFAKAANAGIEKCATPYIALLNADTQVHADWLSSLMARLDAAPPDVAAINSQMLRMDDCERIDDAGDELSWYGAATKRGHDQPAAQFDREQEIFSPCAGATLYRRDFLLRAGGFDADFFAYLEDVDLGLRGRLVGLSLSLPAQGQGSAQRARQQNAGRALRRAPYPQPSSHVCQEHPRIASPSPLGEAPLRADLFFGRLCSARGPVSKDISRSSHENEQSPAGPCSA